MSAQRFDKFAPGGGRGRRLRAGLAYGAGGLALMVAAWFVYDQLTAVHGVKVPEAAPQMVNVVPPPPPPPPPPPEPEPEEQPPEPTEQPEPVPSAAPEPQQQAAQVSIAGAAQAGTDSFGLSAGDGGGIGKPGSSGTCLGTDCGARPGGDGMSEAMYRRYLDSALQERVRGDDELSRLIFSARLSVIVTPDGQVSRVRVQPVNGSRDRKVMARLAEIIRQVSDLSPPPESMKFPQEVTVRGRKPGF